MSRLFLPRLPMWTCVVLCLVAASGCTLNLPLLGRYGELKEFRVIESKRFFERNKIALINVDGYIGQTGGGPFGSLATSVADVTEKLRRAEKDSAVKAVLLRINSPGGEVTASDLIYQDLRAFRRDTKKPIVAYLMGVAASGGYYVALAADSVVAHPTGITGSVGVIMEFVDVEYLLKTVGVRHEAIKSGTMKDIGSPFRGLNPAEKELLNGLCKSMAERFLGLVKERRDAKDEAMKVVSDGRVLSAAQAKELGLVDALGTMDDALAQLKVLARIPDANVVAYRAFSHPNKNAYADYSARMPRPKAMEDLIRALAGQAGPRFLYMWSPGR